MHRQILFELARQRREELSEAGEASRAAARARGHDAGSRRSLSRLVTLLRLWACAISPAAIKIDEACSNGSQS